MFISRSVENFKPKTKLLQIILASDQLIDACLICLCFS